MSSKTTTEKPRSSTVVCFDLPIFTKHSLENNEQKRQYSKFDASYLPIDQAKRSMTLLPVQMFEKWLQSVQMINMVLTEMYTLQQKEAYYFEDKIWLFRP